MATPKSNGSGKRRRELALVEIEALAKQLLVDAHNIETGLETLLAECREVRR